MRDRAFSFSLGGSGGGGGGGGTVTSIDISGGITGLSFSGGPVTTSGTLTLTGTLDEGNGGTGQTTFTLGDILYSSGANTLSKLPIGATGEVLKVTAGVPAWGSDSGENILSADLTQDASHTHDMQTFGLQFDNAGSVQFINGTYVINIDADAGTISIGDGTTSQNLTAEETLFTDGTDTVHFKMYDALGAFIEHNYNAKTFYDLVGTGSPEGVITSDMGGTYRDISTGDIYKKTTDGSNTGWVNLGSGTEFDDSTFRIQDNGDVTKEIAFEASGITTGTTRTITMPDFDVTLGNWFDTNLTQTANRTHNMATFTQTLQNSGIFSILSGTSTTANAWILNGGNNPYINFYGNTSGDAISLSSEGSITVESANKFAGISGHSSATYFVRYYDATISVTERNFYYRSTTPEGVQSASPGSMAFLSTGIVYIKNTGTGNTGWIELATISGTQTFTNKTINLSSNTLTATSAQIASAVTDETGTGSLVFATSPTLVTPILGTPTSGTLTNATGYPLSSLAAASATNTIDNLNFTQTWNWSTADTESLLNINANALTSGDVLSISTSSATTTSSSALLNLTSSNAAALGQLLNISSASTGSVSNGIARFNFSGDHAGIGMYLSSSSTAGTPLRIDANSQLTGNAVLLNANTLTTGAAFAVASSSADTSTRNLATFTNSSSLATGSAPLKLSQSSTAPIIRVTKPNASAANLFEISDGTDTLNLAIAVQTASNTITIPDRTGTITLDTISINAQTGTTYTLVLADAGKYVTLSNAAAIALTIPTNASVAFPIGTTIAFEQAGAGVVTVSGAGVTINSNGSLLSSNGQYASFAIIKTATDIWTLSGNLT
jgi:hypothetical protein